ncbi:MAG: M23 family metallopeptidase [Litorilinea sp.]
MPTSTALSPIPGGTPSPDTSGPNPLISTPAPTAETSVLQTADGQLITAPGAGVNQVGELPSFAPPPVSLDGEYTVQDGDTLWRVSIEMGLDLDATICAVAPDFSLDQPLVIGAILVAPPLGTYCHPVQPGETPLSIATAYDIPVATLVAEGWNRIAPDALEIPLPPQTYVRVPLGNDVQNVAESDSFLAFMLEQPVTLSPYVVHATGGTRTQRPQEPVPANWPYGSGHFEWPVYGWLSNGYRQDHRAIDIAAQPGTFVTAADRGVVIRAGWNSQGYGRFVVIDHNIDYITLYAHLDQVLVAEGDVVGQGQILGTVGSTGNSTGPHLHFEIRDFGRRANPVEYLMR